ncbi:MAG: PEP-CTERM sorting domain-containing protein [Planctomycetota bacterium]|jgi:hypothetical protein
MKRTLLVMALAAVLAASASAGTVTHDFESFTNGQVVLGNGWNSNAGWDAWWAYEGNGVDGSKGATNPASNWYKLVTADGVAAPTAVGEFVTFESSLKFSVGSGTGYTNAYGWNLGLISENTGAGGGVDASFTRRADGFYGFATVGEQAWQWAGWQSHSSLGMAGVTDSSSDWIGQRVTVTMAASGYDVLNELIGIDGSVLASALNAGQALPTLAGASTWYGKVHTQDMGAAGMTYLSMDNVVLTNEIPEPASMALLGLGALLLRRKK